MEELAETAGFEARDFAPTARSRMSKLVAAVFLLAISVPGVFGLLGYDVIAGMTENRALASFPWQEAKTLDFRGFSHKFDAFVSDHFGFRPLLIHWLARTKLAFGSTDNSGVIVGSDNWLFLVYDWTEEKRSTAPADPQILRLWTDTIRQRAAWMANRGTKFLFAIPPQKQTVYAEHLPSWAQRRGDQTRLRQFLDAMRGSNVDVLDLASAMLKAKSGSSERLYYKDDMHWNGLGSLYAALAIVDHLHDEFGVVAAPNIADYNTPTFVTTKKPDGTGLDLGTMLLQATAEEFDFAVERKGGWTTTETIQPFGHTNIFIYTKDAPQLPTIVVYCDSFGYDLHRVIAEYFRRAIFVNWWPEKNNYEETFPLNLIEKEKPDIFLDERYEGGILGPIEPFDSAGEPGH